MSEKLRKDARELFYQALKEADPGKCVLEHIKLKGKQLKVGGESFNLSDFESVYVVAFGKAASSMAAALEKLLGEQITEGIVVSNVRSEQAFQKMDFHLSFSPGTG